MIVYIVGIILILLIVYVFATYNSLVGLNNKVKEAFSTMDVYLKKRWDLIPNIVETVKGYAKHEKDAFEEITKMRSGAYESLTDEEKIKTNEELTKGIGKLIALVEDYPDLKASKNFQKLSEDLTQIEDEIANSRKYYNAVVRLFNNKVEMFPSNLIASMFGYKTKPMFEANEGERENVDVKL